MIIRKTFIWSQDLSGNGFDDGWVEKGAKSMHFPGGPMTVAHDVLEHPRKPTGTFEEEFRAFGAMVYVRYLSGDYWAPRKNILYEEMLAYNLANELADMLSACDRDVRMNPKGNGLLDEEEAERAWDHLYRVLQDPATFETLDMEDEDDVAKFNHAQGNLVALFTQMRAGFLWAKKRFGDRYPYDVTYLFKKVEEVVKKSSPAELGDKICITVDTSTLEVSGRVISWADLR